MRNTIIKGLLLFSSAWLILTMVLIAFSQAHPWGNKDYQYYRTISIWSFIILMVLGGITTLLVCKYGIQLPKTKSDRFRFSSCDFQQLSAAIMNANKYAEFSDPVKLECNSDDSVQIQYMKNWKKLYVFELVRTNELTFEKLTSYTELFWEYVCGLAPNIKLYDIHLIQCICVDRITTDFRNFTENNVEQDFGRYQLPVGISFGGNTIYVAKQKGGAFIAKYKHLRKIFMKILSVSGVLEQSQMT